MLTEIRSGISRWLGWVIVVIITIPFALFGINSYFEGGNVNVATVNGTDIDYQTYQRALSDRQRAMTQRFGNSLGRDFFATDVFKQQVLDGLVDDLLLSNDSQDQGYRLGDAQLLNQIQSSAAFQQDGQFNAERYQQTLRSAGYTTQRYEQLQRQQFALSQVRDAFSQSAFIPTNILNKTLALSEQERNAQYVLISADRFLDDVSIDAAEIQAEYDNNQERYRAAARMKVDYVELSVDELAEQVVLTEEDLMNLYESNGDRYRTAEQRQASHILINVAQDADDETISAAQAKAENLSKRAKAGEDFSELAKTNSDDPGSANNGGDLGVIERGLMVKPFEDAVFEMQLNDISEPVRSQFGFHVIKLTALAAEQQKPFEDAKADIEKEERRRIGETEFLEMSERFRNLVYEEPESFDAVKDELGLAIKQSEWFTEDEGTGVADTAIVRAAAFSEDVLSNDLNSEALEVNADKLVSVRRLDYEESKIKSLELVTEEIQQNLKLNKASQAARESSEELLAKLNAGDQWDSATESMGVISEELQGSRKDASGGELQGVSRLLFEAARPVADQPVFGSGEVGNNTFTVFKLNSVDEVDLASVDDADKQRLADLLKYRWGAEQYTAYQTGLRETADIRIFSDQL